MATDSLQPQPAAAALLGHCDVLNALLNLKGAIRLSREAVYNQMGTNDNLVSAEGVLVLAETELERIYATIDCGRIANVWPASSEEAAHV